MLRKIEENYFRLKEINLFENEIDMFNLLVHYFNYSPGE